MSNTVESILDQLAQIAAELEKLSHEIKTVPQDRGTMVVLDAITEDRIRQCLEKNLTQGNEAVAVAEAVDLVNGTLESDGLPLVPERVLRAVLPKLMRELFNVRLSCSIRYEGKYARGWRGLSPR